MRSPEPIPYGVDRPPVARFALAAVSVIAALGLRFALDSILSASASYFIFTLAVIVASRFGGRGPALASSAFSIVCAWYFFSDPRHTFRLPDQNAASALALFRLVVTVISVPMGQTRTAMLAAARSRQRLDFVNVRRDRASGRGLPELVT
jgi:K+-sensing histidine kinase KdpD